MMPAHFKRDGHTNQKQEVYMWQEMELPMTEGILWWKNMVEFASKSQQQIVIILQMLPVWNEM